MKILVFYSQSLRDIIFSTPVLRALKIQTDQAEIHCALPGSLFPVLEENPYKDRLLASEEITLASIGNGHYNVLVNLGAPYSTLLYAKLKRIKVVTYKRNTFRRFLMSRFKINKLPNRHLVDRMMDSIKSLGVRPDDMGLDYFIPDRDKVPGAWLPEGFKHEFVLLSISATYETCKLPVDRVIELCDKINKPVVIIGGKDDVPTAEIIIRFFQRGTSDDYEKGLIELNKKTIVYNGAGKFNINQQASLVKQARCVFTFDNEIVAIASAFKKQVYLLLGNTIALFGEYPYRTRFVILENNKLNCRPCSVHGYSRCPRRHFMCMNGVVFDFYVP